MIIKWDQQRQLTLVGFIVVFSIAVTAAVSQAQVQWSSGVGGNDHYYQRIDQTGLTFSDAKAAAESMTFLGLPGHLAIFETANYTNEFNFVNTNVYSPGVASNRIYWVGATTQSNADPWIWTDGSTVPNSIVNSWSIDFAEGNAPSGVGFFQPNNTLLDYIQTNSSGFVSGYVVEFQAIPEPSFVVTSIVALAALLGFRKKIFA